MSDPVLLADETKVYSEFVELTDHDDGIHVRADGAEIVSCQIKDLREPVRRWKPHSDGIQLIPPPGLIRRGWFAGSRLSNVTVMNCTVKALQSFLQPITGFDGLFSGLRIIGNTVDTESLHKITFCGLLSGEIRGNRDSAGAVVPGVLYPWKIGGGEEGEPNVWVIGFAEHSRLDYLDVVGDVVGDVIDKRRMVFNDTDVFLTDFDADAFWAAADAVYVADAEAHGRALRRLALEFGRRVVNGGKPDSDKPGRAGELVVVSEGKMKIFNPLEELDLMRAQDVSVGVLTNNPMAIKKYEDWLHEVPRHLWPDFMRVGPDGRLLRGDLLRIDHPSWGIRIGVHILLNKQRRGLATVREFIEEWAPYKGRGADNSKAQVDGYVDHVANRVGVGPDAEIVISDWGTARKMVLGMIEYENNWSQPYTDEMIDDGLIYAGVKAPGERAPEVKPATQSGERKGAAILIGAGGTGLSGSLISWLVANGLSEEAAQAVVTGGATVGERIAEQSNALDWMQWMLIINTGFVGLMAVGLTVGGIWWYKARNRAGRLLLR